MAALYRDLIEALHGNDERNEAASDAESVALSGIAYLLQSTPASEAELSEPEDNGDNPDFHTIDQVGDEQSEEEVGGEDPPVPAPGNELVTIGGPGEDPVPARPTSDNEQENHLSGGPVHIQPRRPARPPLHPINGPHMASGEHRGIGGRPGCGGSGSDPTPPIDPRLPLTPDIHVARQPPWRRPLWEVKQEVKSEPAPPYDLEEMLEEFGVFLRCREQPGKWVPRSSLEKPPRQPKSSKSLNSSSQTEPKQSSRFGLIKPEGYDGKGDWEG